MATAFIQASINVSTGDNLNRTPRNLEDLIYFLKNAGLNRSEGMHNLRYADYLVQGKDMTTAMSPMPLGNLSSSKKAKPIRKKEDSKQNIIEMKILNPPLWG